jgi:hypothetical protein
MSSVMQSRPSIDSLVFYTRGAWQQSRMFQALYISL